MRHLIIRLLLQSLGQKLITQGLNDMIIRHLVPYTIPLVGAIAEESVSSANFTINEFVSTGITGPSLSTHEDKDFDL